MASDQITERELSYFRRQILSQDLATRRTLVRVLDQMASAEHSHFLRLCYRLMDDHEPQVRSQILWHLKRSGDRDDPIAESKAMAALNEERLRARALLALGTVGTATAVPILYERCLAEEMFALLSFARQVRSKPQRQEALRLSREWLMSEVYQRRDEALMALCILSNAADEERYLLRAYNRYGDELVVWALGAGSPRMLHVLSQLLGRWPEGSAQYNDVSRALTRLRRRLTSDGALREESVTGPLKDYL